MGQDDTGIMGWIRTEKCHVNLSNVHLLLVGWGLVKLWPIREVRTVQQTEMFE